MTTATSSLADTINAATPSWTATLNAPILIRAAIVALILGSVLNTINQAEAIFGTAKLDLLQFALVYVTPFIVVTASQILGSRQALRDGRKLPAGERFLVTLFAHGIPSRAILTGVLVGTANTAITVAVTLTGPGGLAELPGPLLAQAFTLPVLFGLLSQAISYRRAKKRLAATRLYSAV